MRLPLVISALVAVLVLAGCDAEVEDSVASVVPEECPAGAAEVLPQGQRDGPVLLALPERLDFGRLTNRDEEGRAYWKVLAWIQTAAAPLGTNVRFRMHDDSPSDGLVFDHGSEDGRPRPVATHEVYDRGQDEHTPYDIPGYAMLPGPGCFLIAVDVGDGSYGPFALPVGS